MAFCTNCGAKLDDDAKFCPSCGTKTGAEDGNSTQAGAPPLAQTVQVQQAEVGAVKKTPWGYFCGALKKYAVFQGRARRAEYWWYFLFYLIFYTVALIIDGAGGFFITEGMGVFSLLYSLAFLLPTWSVMVRRYHDLDKRAWWCLVPVYGFILLFFEGTAGPNRFGANPKQVN